MGLLHAPRTPLNGCREHGRGAVVENGTLVKIRFKNTGNIPLNVTIFNLVPLLGVSKLYPGSSSYEMVNAKDEMVDSHAKDVDP